jgi:hypothetical protein
VYAILRDVIWRVHVDMRIKSAIHIDPQLREGCVRFLSQWKTLGVHPRVGSAVMIREMLTQTHTTLWTAHTVESLFYAEIIPIVV